jgi:hypothetical protein
MSIRVLDPTFGVAGTHTERVPRLTSLEGCTVGLLDNSKIKVRELLDAMEDTLRAQHGVANVIRLKKPDASRPAPEEVVAEMRACEAIISAVGD